MSIIKTQRYRAQIRTESILPGLVSFGLLNHKNDVASKASNRRLVILISVVACKDLEFYTNGFNFPLGLELKSIWNVY